MKNLFLSVLGLCVLLEARAAQSLDRFSLRPEILSFSNCLAQPGAVPVPLHLTNANLEITNWAAAATSSNVPGEFALRFRTPTRVGSVMVYDAAHVSCLLGTTWQKLSPGADAGRRLQIFALPTNAMAEAVKITVSSRLRRDERARLTNASYQAILPFVALVPPHLVNVAAQAAVTVSSADKPSEGFQPLPWLNKPETLLDGFIDERRNFSTAKRDTPITPDAPEWIVLSWEKPQTLRGLAFFRGTDEPGLGDFEVDVHVGTGDPRFIARSLTNGWMRAPGRYRWHGLHLPGLKLDYQFTYYPTPLAHVAWQTEDRRGGWLADHEPPRTIARAGDRMWLGAFAEAGDSIVETDADANKLWGIDRIWVAIPHEICVDGDFYYGWCEGGWIGDNQAIIQIETRTKRSRKIFQRDMPKKEASREAMRASETKRGVTGFQVVSNLARTEAGPGDIRLSFSVFEGKPVCVLYDFKVDGFAGQRVPFSSPWRTVWCDRVGVIEDVALKVSRAGNEFTFEAAVPLKTIHMEPKTLKETRADVGRIMSDQTGSAAASRVYWANKHTAIMSDLPSEAGLQPNLWGLFRFEL